MSVSITKAQLHKLPSRYERLKNHLQSVRKEGEHVVEKVLRTGETAGMAFGLGLINGYHGPVTVAKVPLELLLAGGLEIAGYMGLAGKHSDHLNNLGDGALAAFAVIKGVQVGAEIKAKHTQLAAPAAQPQVTKGTRISADDIRANIEHSAAANQAVPVPAR